MRAEKMKNLRRAAVNDRVSSRDLLRRTSVYESGRPQPFLLLPDCWEAASGHRKAKWCVYGGWASAGSWLAHVASAAFSRLAASQTHPYHPQLHDPHFMQGCYPSSVTSIGPGTRYVWGLAVCAWGAKSPITNGQCDTTTARRWNYSTRTFGGLSTPCIVYVESELPDTS